MAPPDDGRADRDEDSGGGNVTPTVLFDLDGTLVDTTYLHTMAWWRALDAAGERRPMSAIHPLIGMGGDQLLQTLLGRSDPELDEAHGRYFTEYYPLVRALPGADRLLQLVAGEGGRVLLVTSASPDDLPSLLAPLSQSDRIEGIVHADLAARSKPAPDLFDAAKERYHLDPRTTVAVGDAVWDVESAGKAGFPCVGLLTGGINRSDLLGAGALAVYRDCDELCDAWSSSPLGQLLGRTASA